MARKVILKSKSPLKVGEKWICTCGLSKGWQEENCQPFCDGSHTKARAEEDGKVYTYDAEGNVISSEEVYS